MFPFRLFTEDEYSLKWRHARLITVLTLIANNRLKKYNFMKPKSYNSVWRNIRQGVFLIYSVMIFMLASAQAQTIDSDYVNIDRGIRNGTPYSISDIENINLANGNLNINIPLATLPAGRGGLASGISLVYNSKLYENGIEELTDELQGGTSFQNTAANSDDGGWQIVSSIGYTLKEENIDKQIPCGSLWYQNAYRYKVFIIYPDGSKKQFRPTGYGNQPFQGIGDIKDYYNVNSAGTVYAYNSTNSGGTYSCGISSYQATTGPMVYYSTDGSYTRLVINPGGGWTLYFPDGGKTTNGYTDRNENNITSTFTTISPGVWEKGLVDQLGRKVYQRHDSSTGEDYVYMVGVDGEELKWTIKWKDIHVRKRYQTTGAVPPDTRGRGGSSKQNATGAGMMVSELILPAQLGDLKYQFGYNGSDTPLPDEAYSYGWGELNSITLPSEAVAKYEYELDDSPSSGSGLPNTREALQNAVTKKTLEYLSKYDNTTTPVSEVWTYLTDPQGGGGSVTGPDGGERSLGVLTSRTGSPMDGLTASVSNPDGSSIYKLWAVNAPAIPGSSVARQFNPYVKTEFTFIPDASGNQKVAIKDYSVDKNGNITKVAEYDFVPESFITRSQFEVITGFSSAADAYKIRTIETTYHKATPDASDTTTNHANAYWNLTAPAIINAPATTTIKDNNGLIVSYSEFTYDNYSTTGNLKEIKTWNNNNPTNSPRTVPLNSDNSISIKNEYDQYGNVIETTDANGNRTQITYGSIVTPTGTVSNLYPTQTVAASETAIQRTSTAEYDFYTGLVTSVTDVDNSVTSGTEYDALGRPTKVMAAVGTPLEIWTQTEYNVAARRVITRSDLYVKGDAKKVATQFYDQLGRVRLSKTLEDAATQSATNETDGIKVQTRYRTGNPNSYQLVSNPYRAATSAAASSEPSMGWTRSKSWNTGKKAETETFLGAALPAPWGTNASSTGVVKTDMDADRTLVTDQAGKQRMSQTDALGQLVNIWEIKAAEAGQTEAISFGNPAIALNGLKTSYSYDTLNNLTTVNQGVQTRTFAYSSLSRLTSAQNPESGTIGYQYDANGNLTQKTDSRPVTTTYVYDALNRVTTRSYSDSVTPTVTYTYDNVTNAKGKLTKVASTVSATEYTSFDVMGRITSHQQTTDGTAYTTAYVYNLAGALIEETYPSSRVVKYDLDADGDLARVQSKKNTNSGFWNYADNFSYTAAGAVKSMQLGNGKWESAVFNARLQPTQIALGTTQGGTDKLKLDFDYGTNQNNGNVISQQITVPTLGAAAGFTATQVYLYDSLNRLQSAEETTPSQQGWKQTYKYDRYGNRRFNTDNPANTTTLEANCQQAVCNPTIDPATNQLIGYTYDDAGNTTVDAQGRTFTYDGENKQTKVVSGGQTVGEYSYDGDGRRVKKYLPSSGETTIFVYDASGKLVAEYATTVEPAATAQVSYLTNDHLGSPRMTTDKDGRVFSRRDFMPFGEEITSTQTVQRNINLNYGSDTVRQKFTAYERDIESDLDYAQARYYKSAHGRFTSVDPLYDSADLEIPQSWNRYSYVINNPLRYTDPTGMVWVDDGGRPRWIADDEFEKMSNKNMYKLWTETEYNSTEGRVRLDPKGPNADNLAGFTIIGPNIEPETNGGAMLGAVAVAVMDGPQPGPADLLALGIIFGLIGNAATATHEVAQLPLVPTMPHIMMNENADANSAPSNPEPDAGNLSDKVGKIATALGVTEKQVRDAIHKVKRNLRAGGKTRNPDVEVDLDTGEVYPKVPGGGRGDSIGNIWEFLP